MVLSCCCFWNKSQPRYRACLHITNYTQFISLQDMLRLLVRPNVGIVVIEGIGGSGKTWAARAVYQAAKTSNLFDEYAWVSLSMSCSMRQCINKIATSLSCKTRDNLSVERTKTVVREYLTQRKFLLVLDNAYFTKESILEYLGVPHPQQQNLGSKIFVTTRTTRASRVMEPDVVLAPQPLTSEESRSLLHEKIGKEDISFAHDLISNCYGVPLIIILLAGVLCDAPTQEAFGALVANAHVVLATQVSVFHTMQRMVKFVYHQLPSNNARHCLLYCLLFPEDQGIPAKELIWHWVMDGLLPEAISFDEACYIAKEILDVLVKHGMVYLEDSDCVRVHDVIRETLHDEHVAKKNNSRMSLMYTEMECLTRSPPFSFITSLLLRGNFLLRYIPDKFFCCMRTLEMLDLSFTGIKELPSSISHVTRLRMLLLIGCNHLEEIRNIGSLVQLEVLDASYCISLKSIESGSFDLMVSLRVLDLSATSITHFTRLPMFGASMELCHLNLQGCQCLEIDRLYGVSKSGAVQNLQAGSIQDFADWMGMLWLPCGLTVQLSDRFGMKVSFDLNRDNITCIHASDSYFFNCLEKKSPLWFSCFEKFQITISPLMDVEIMGTDAQEMKSDFNLRNSCVRAMRFTHPIDLNKYLEIDGTAGIPSDLSGILCHAELISLKRLTMTSKISSLNIRSMKAMKELWIEDCVQLETILTPDEVQALSEVGKLHVLRISNIENLLSFCKGMENVTSFNCIKHLLLDCCPNLACIFPSQLHIPSLETLHIKFCDMLEKVFDTSVLGEDSLPRLHSLKLWELPELTCVCGGVLPSLKKLEVRGCAKLRKIPVGVNENSPLVTAKGEKLWWDNLVWDDESIKRWVLFRNWGPLLPHLATEG